jgi:hypothetical protein
LAILGPRPYVAFLGYQIPRLVSGAAFEFTHLGQHAVFLTSRNFSVAALERSSRCSERALPERRTADRARDLLAGAGGTRAPRRTRRRSRVDLALA